MRLSPLLLLSSIFSVSFCDNTVQIGSASELISFSNNVNSGSSYAGVTVVLTADIDFSKPSGQFTPIGNSSKCFLGIFDGQGHTISNLAVSSSLQHAGLFGYSNNVTIQNVVIDSTCSFTSSYSSGALYIGSIIGCSSASMGPCMIKNNVNMASVTFKGETSTNLYIGGIIGGLYSSSYSSVIRNCVNYGTVTHSGTYNGNQNIGLGGIAGYVYGASLSSSQSSSCNYIQNCANYGSIIHNGTSSGTLYMGGISCGGYCSTISNCVSSGVISSNKESNYYIGTIIDAISSSTTITHCYWTSGVGYSSVYGYGGTVASASTSSLASLNQTTVDKLNEYAAKQDSTWSKWFMVHLNGGSINNITQESLVEIQGHFPDPVKEGNTFLSWCKDAECNDVFNPKTDSVSGVTDIYAKWDTSITITNYVVTFDFDNGTTVNVTFSYSSPIVYPAISEREGYTLYWNNYHEYMPAKNITITAQWTPNNYTVTFDANGGNDLGTTSIKVTFNSPYDTLPTPAKDGYTFIGWVTDNNDTVTNEAMVAIPNNHTLHARWKEIPTQYVEIVFGTKDMTEEEVSSIVKKYANEGDFTIIKVEGGGDGDGTRVIIKFNSAEKAENFVEVIKESGGTKNVGFISEGDILSFAITYCSMVLLSIFIWM